MTFKYFRNFSSIILSKNVIITQSFWNFKNKIDFALFAANLLHRKIYCKFWNDIFCFCVFQNTVLRGNKGHKLSSKIAYSPLLVRTVPYKSWFFFCQKYVWHTIVSDLFANIPDSKKKNFIVQFFVLFGDIWCYEKNVHFFF